MATKTDTRELVALEKKYWQAIQDRDARTAKLLTDDECFISGAQGFSRISKEELEEMMESRQVKLNRFRISDDTQVRLLTDDVAVLSYKVREELTVDGKPITAEFADSSTWVKRDGQWACALHTEALIGDPYGRDRRPGA